MHNYFKNLLYLTVTLSSEVRSWMLGSAYFIADMFRVNSNFFF